VSATKHNNVVQLVPIPPKTKQFRKGSADCIIGYNIKDRHWYWKVTMHIEPQVFTGTSPSEAIAQYEVAMQLHKLHLGPEPKCPKP